MSTPTSTRAVVLQKYLESGFSTDISTNFVVKELPIPDSLPEDSLLVKTLYLSNDPAQALWMNKPGEHAGVRIDMAALPLGAPFQAYSISRVVKVGGEGGPANVDDLVQGRGDWADYCVVKKSDVRVKKEIPGISSSHFLGALGISGATSYVALHFVLKPKETDTLVVTGAAGAVGHVAVQYAKKVLGVKRVVGIAGSDEKCKWLKSIGADEAVNYKSPTFVDDLAKATPDKVDKVFDNVAGPILDEIIARMNPRGVVVAVGATSVYNKLDQGTTIKNYVKVVTDGLSIIGYTLMHYFDRLAEAEETLTKAATDGKLILDGTETLIDVQGRIDEIPRIWTGLVAGTNTGKLITKLSD